MVIKKISILFCVFLLLASFVMAEEIIDDTDLSIEEIESELGSVNAGIVPGNVFYGLDKALDNIGYALSMDKEAKGLRIAQERLEEVKLMSESGDEERAQKAKEAHKESIEKVRERIENRLEEDGNEEALRSMVRFEKVVSLQEEQLSELKEKLSNLTPEQRNLIIQELIAIEGNLGNVKGKIEDAEENYMIRVEEKSGKSSIEIKNELGKLREDKRIKAEIMDDKSVVTIDYKFKEESKGAEPLTINALLERVLEQVKTNMEEARTETKISIDDDDDLSETIQELEENEIELEENETKVDDDSSKIIQEIEENETEVEIGIDSSVLMTGQVVESFLEAEGLEDQSIRLRIDIRQKKEGKFRAEVSFRYRFLSGADPEEIYSDIVENTNSLNTRKLSSVAIIKQDEDSDEDSEEED